MLWEDLIREYLAFRAGRDAGRRKADLSDMTDREQAGLWIKLAQPGQALAMFDSKPRGSGPFPWPGARALIEQAELEEREAN